MMWREGRLIQFCKLGIKAKCIDGLRIFRKSNKSKNREQLFRKVCEWNFKAVCPISFSIMINYVFEGLENGMGVSLFAENGAIWQRGKNIDFIVKKLQEAVTNVEERYCKWGFKFSVDKTKPYVTQLNATVPLPVCTQLI